MSQTNEPSTPSDPATVLSEEETKFIPTKCGEPLQNRLPEIDGDPFTLLLESRKEKDRARCEVWKEEVQNLLIFAGLFSAVVTAFIIESYKSLRQDTGDLSALILQRILVQLESGPNGTTSPPLANSTQVPFSPTPSDVHVNILWFLSLVLSLSTVLIGIIALQWLREHLRSRPELEPQIGFSYHHMSVESLDSWYLPQIFTILPVLLLLALVFFLVGVIEFLWNLNSTVAIPIIVAVGMTLLFLLGTTIFSTLQALSLFLPRWLGEDKPRSPCPYRSPQSWAFHQLIRPLITTLLKIIQSPDRDKQLQSHDLLSRVSSDCETYLDRQRMPTKLIFRQDQRDTWTEFGIAWLFQRDLDAMGREARLTHIDSSDISYRPVPVYDTVQGVMTVNADGHLATYYWHSIVWSPLQDPMR